jgi:hypothetical protein
MNIRFINFTGSPDANEGTGMNSKYSTERSPTTALLFEAAHTVLLPLIRMPDHMPSVEILPETRCNNTGCSLQE